MSNIIKRFRGACGALGQKTKVPKATAGPSEEPWRAKVQTAAVRWGKSGSWKVRFHDVEI